LVPDLDDELCFALDLVEEVLLALAAREWNPDGPTVLAGPLVGWVALEALARVEGAIAPTQSSDDRPAPCGGRVLAPDRRYEHRPLRLVRIDEADLAVLSAAAAALGHQLAIDPCGQLAEAVTAGAEAATGKGPAATPMRIVELFARVTGLLDLADTDDSVRLARRVAAVGDYDLVLSAAEEVAYQRTVDRFNEMWTSGSEIDRYLY
jgi:hypothetical protein